MRTLSDHEKRTLRRATIGIAIYLVCFFGFQAWRSLEKQRTEYQQLVADAQELRTRIQMYQDKAQVVKRMMEDFQLDPAKLSRETIVGKASSAIQKAAASSGIQVGTVRESTSRASADAVATVQFEGSGPIPAVAGMLHRMQMLGYPLIIDSVQITPDNRPGNVKVSLTVVILDFDSWKNPEASHA